MGDIQKILDNRTWTPVPDLRKHIHFIRLAEMNVPVLSLKYEREAYMQSGRKDKAALLNHWLLQHAEAMTKDNHE